MKRLWWILFPVLCLGILLVLWVTSQSSQPSTGPDVLGAQPSGAMGSTTTSFLVLRIALALVLVLGLILGTKYMLRASGWSKGAQALGHLQVLDRCWLGPRKALYTVRIGERHVVVGVTEANIQPVVELAPGEGESLYPAIEETPAGPGFQEILRQAARKVGRG